MIRFDSILPVRRLFDHHMIPISWQKIFLTDPTSSKVIKYALAQELKSKTGVSGVRWRLSLLSMKRTAAQIEVKTCSLSLCWVGQELLYASSASAQEHWTTVAQTLTEHLLKINRFEGLFPWSNAPLPQTAWLVTVQMVMGASVVRVLSTASSAGPSKAPQNSAHILWSIWALVLHDHSSTCMVCFYW